MQDQRRVRVDRVSICAGPEYSHRLVTNRQQRASLSFHITTDATLFHIILEARGQDELVLCCLQEEGREVHFTPGMAVYLPPVYGYRHIIGPKSLAVAVACPPLRV